MPNPNTTLSPTQPDRLANLFAPLHSTTAEHSALRAAEADQKAFARLQAEINRNYKVRSIDRLGLAPKVIQPGAFRPVAGSFGIPTKPSLRTSAAVLAELFHERQVSCDCLAPLRYTGLKVYSDMLGPEQWDVTRGIVGAIRQNPNEYEVNNLGETTGTTKISMRGQMHIVFECIVPRPGRWCLIHPSGNLFVRGHSRVVGHGNSTTCMDAKVWVDYYQVLELGPTILELSGGQIHYDGTRSEDRTKNFVSDVELPPRAVFFQSTRAGEILMLTFRIEVQADANEDGIACGAIDMFGLPAVCATDYDSFIVEMP